MRNQFDTDVKSNEHAHSHVVGSLRADLSPTLAMTFTVDAMKNSIDDVYWGTPLIAGRLDESLLGINHNNLPANVHDDDVTWLSWKTDWKVFLQGRNLLTRTFACTRPISRTSRRSRGAASRWG
ncbi:MAG: hypothetical protein JNM76_05455 [Betaproteobacteria bacterium]|nr:hypothetical protein [Betaproteobacteria bacterium]